MAGKWKRRRGTGGREKKKILISGLSAMVLVLAIFGAGKTEQPKSARPGQEGAAEGGSEVNAEYEEGSGNESVKTGAHACSLLSACAELWFPAGFDSFHDAQEEGVKGRTEGLTRFLAEQLMERIPWYVEAQRGKYFDWAEEDPAYINYKRKQEQAKEYSRLADCLDSSRILADSGLIAGDGSSDWSPAALQSGLAEASSALEREGKQALTAGEEGSHGKTEGGEQEEDAEGGEEAGSFASGFSMGTTAGLNLLERAGLPVLGKTYLVEQLADYDYVMKHFYTVHPTAAAGRDMIQAETFLAKDFSLKQETDDGKPQILIYHSHSQEEFADYHTGNKKATIVGVGEYLAQLLEEKGYQVIHDTSVYDLRDGKLDRNKAYTYALKGIEKILEENPSIEVILDIHRDGVGNSTRLVKEVDGKTMAQIMFFNGTSQTPDGPISYLENPNREDNLAFSFQMKLCADAFYPGYARNIYLKGLRYNLHLRPRSALIEVGAQTNTYEEARNAMEPLAELLDTVLGNRNQA